LLALWRRCLGRHAHDHGPRTPAGDLVELKARILAKNDALAQKNRPWFKGRELGSTLANGPKSLSSR
jgi:hydrogenase nickel incorporation protein HypB